MAHGLLAMWSWFRDGASRAENAHCPRGTFCINVHFLMQPIRYKSQNLPNDGSRTATRWSKFRLPIWSNMILVSWMVVMTTMTYKDNTDRELEGCVHSFSSVWNTIKCNTVWQHDPTRTRVGCRWLHASSTRTKHVTGTTKDAYRWQDPNANNTPGHHSSFFDLTALKIMADEIDSHSSNMYSSTWVHDAT